MSRVFVVHEPSFWDRKQKRMVPLDIASSDKFGRRVVIFPGLDRPPRGDKAMERIFEVLADYKPNDHLLVVGHPDLLIWAAAVALRNTGGRISLLKWNNRNRDYEILQSPESLAT